MQVACSARDFAQTLGLARLHGLQALSVGRHGGGTAIGKARAILQRAAALREFGRAARPDLALSHNSYAHGLAAWSLGIPYVTIMDYEHTPANHLSFRLADRVLLPSAVPIAAVVRYGASPEKVFHYPGFKEQVYLEDFEPNRSLLDDTLPPELWDRFVIVVARPPADFAIYHRFKNVLFDDWFAVAGRDPGVRVIFLPRTGEQRRRALEMELPSVIVPEQPLDGANLVYHADLVVSAGGTMNREAAILGVPAYSIFAGRTASVDIALAAQGRLRFVRDKRGLEEIQLVKKGGCVQLRNPGLRSKIVAGFLGGERRMVA